jgi:hypothetical protein
MSQLHHLSFTDKHLHYGGISFQVNPAEGGDLSCKWPKTRSSAMADYVMSKRKTGNLVSQSCSGITSTYLLEAASTVPKNIKSGLTDSAKLLRRHVVELS